MADIVLIQTSMNPESKSAKVVEKMAQYLDQKGISYEIIDIREYEIEMCDGRKINQYSQDVQNVYNELENAQAYVIAYPVYNNSYSGATKNLLDIMSKAMENKICGLVSVSASPSSTNNGQGELRESLNGYFSIETPLPYVHYHWGDFNNQGEIRRESKMNDKLEDMLDKLIDHIHDNSDKNDSNYAMAA